LSSMLPRPLRMYPFNAVAFTGCGKTASNALCNRARLQSCADKVKRINRFVTCTCTLNPPCPILAFFLRKGGIPRTPPCPNPRLPTRCTLIRSSGAH
jgi:hypothetical protein